MSENTLHRETEEEWQKRESANAAAQHALDTSLSDNEKQKLAIYEGRMAQYRRRCGVVEELHEQLQNEGRLPSPQEQSYFDKWEKYRYTLILGIGEEADLKQLRARNERADKLNQYERGLKADSLMIIDSHAAAHPLLQSIHGRGWHSKYNLSGRIAQYEEDKSLDAPRNLCVYAREVIAQVELEKKGLKTLAALRWPNDTEKAKIWRRVMADVLQQFTQHVAKDLVEQPRHDGEPDKVMVVEGKSSDTPASPWDELLLLPFKLADLKALLTSLKVIQDGKWHLGELAPRNAAPKSAFPAAYRVLSNERNKLMKGVAATVWGDLFRTEFEAPISKRIANYNEGMLDLRPEFTKYMIEAQDWVDNWKREQQPKSESV